MPRARAAIALLIATLAAGVAAAPAGAWGDRDDAQHSLRSPVTDESFYFVMADRFANGDTSNDRGHITPDDRLVHGYDPTARGFYQGGDLKGLLSKIDYIRRLGTTSIWLTPSFKNKAVQLEDGPSAGYHGYWITDFTQIDPHLGTNEDLQALVDAAHRRGMKVYFDIITNHTADVIGYQQGARRGYVSKDVAPYRDADGNVFDDRDFAGRSSFPPLSPATSFPYQPVLDPAETNLKVPAWLNDLTLYHNRGDTTFVGENSLYGDFFGLDDLFTEHPTVVEGMIDVYKTWIEDFGVDGFRIDTMKHVNDEFWQEFGPEVLEFARREGKREFFMFGEVFDTTKSFTSHFTTTDRMQAVLDFPFQDAARGFASRSAATDGLKTFFEDDDWYTDADSNVYQLPTFLGNHDMGRIGHFVVADNPGAGDAEWVARDRLAHELMYFSRGNPVVYYGDEQGFTGSGGDQVARQTMFASRVPDYLDDDLLGTTNTHIQDNFVPGHPLYSSIADLAALTRRHDALRDGAQQHRMASARPGVYAFSRIDRREQREYVVALNNAETAQTEFIPTWTERDRFKRLYGSGPRTLRSGGDARLKLTVPALSAVVYKLDGRIEKSRRAPAIALREPAPAERARGRMEVRADVFGDSFYEVTFQADTGRGWKSIGTDDNAPYRVFHDVSGLRAGTDVRYRSIVLDNRGDTRRSAARTVDAPPAAITLTASRVGKQVTARATVDPDHAFHEVRFERSVAGGPFVPIGTDDSAPSPYTAVDDITSQPPGTALRYRATLTDGRDGGTVTSNIVTLLAPLPPDPTVRTATIHYNRPDGQYANWGLHLFGDALAPGEATPEWTNPTEFEGTDAYGAVITIDIDEPLKQVGFIIHGQPPNENTKDTDPDRFFTPAEAPEIWLRQGDTTIYESEPPK